MMAFPQIYLIVSTILLAFITIIWSSKDFANVTFKMFFGIITVMGIYVIIQSRVFG